MPCSVELRGRNRRSRGASSSERAPKSSMGFPTSQRGPTLNSGKSSPSPHQVFTKSSPSPHQVFTKSSPSLHQVSHECKSPLTISALRAVCHTRPHLCAPCVITWFMFSSRSHLVLIRIRIRIRIQSDRLPSGLPASPALLPKWQQLLWQQVKHLTPFSPDVTRRSRHMSQPVFARCHTPMLAIDD